MEEPKVEDVVNITFHEPDLSQLDKIERELTSMGKTIASLIREAECINPSDDIDIDTILDLISDLEYSIDHISDDAIRACRDLQELEGIVDEWRSEVKSYRLTADEKDELNQLRMLYKLKEESK